jgi:hypothetical protein
MEELMEFYSAKQPFPWHWGNSLYLEWYSQTNGRVVIEAAHYQLELDAEPAWILSEEEEIAQQAANAEAMGKFMERMGMVISQATGEHEDEDDDPPQSPEEARPMRKTRECSCCWIAYLHDALRGLESAEEEALATPQWRHQTRLKVIDVLAQTDELLREGREVLSEGDDETGIF